jgi:AraC-like DNA-binding protein
MRAVDQERDFRVSDISKPLQNANLTVYHWGKGFLALGDSLVWGPSLQPFHRLSASLIFALRRPFKIVKETGDCLEAQGVLIGPGVERRSFTAVGSELMILDAFVATPEYFTLVPVLQDAPFKELPVSVIEPFADRLREACCGGLQSAELRCLVHDIIFHCAQQPVRPRELDPRIQRVLELIDEYPLGMLNLNTLSREVALSSSRLRHLFREQLGCDFTRYRRWVALWKAGQLHVSGTSFAKSAAVAGFYDAAHLNRAFKQTFGANPSVVLQKAGIRSIACKWE